MSQDIRSQITASGKPRVSPRNSSLLPEVKNPQDFQHLESIDSSESIELHSKIPPSKKIKQLEAELKQLPNNGKRLAIHLEQKIRQDFKSYCDRHEITPETFVEASLIVLENYPEIKAQIVTQAQTRLSIRKRAGLLRRTISMLEEA
jgi:hypothetical protein